MQIHDQTDIINLCQNLRADIDKCINDIVKARLKNDGDLETKTMFAMESLMVNTMQDLSVIIDFLQEN